MHKQQRRYRLGIWDKYHDQKNGKMKLNKM